jgi:glycosyltransferase involved in cell wall biosynthesis
VYPSERDPTQLLDALQQLKADGLDGKRLKVILRASGFDRELRPFLEERSISDIVLLEPGIAYGEALKEMGSVDGLLILQASNCNHQIPAKLYEYIRSGTPIVALTDPTGDTASVIRDIGGEFLAPLNDTEAIKDVLRRFVAKTEASAHVHRVANVERFSRRTHVLALEQLLRERSTN